MYFMKNPLWFKAKRYGRGWYPVTWQGWAVTGIAIAAIVLNSVLIERYSRSADDVLISLLFTIVVIALLIGICFLTGEKPRWRWGGK